MKMFLPNGKEYKGPTHKMGDVIMSGATHTASSQVLTTSGTMMDGGKSKKRASGTMAERMSKLRSMRGSMGGVYGS